MLVYAGCERPGDLDRAAGEGRLATAAAGASATDAGCQGAAAQVGLIIYDI